MNNPLLSAALMPHPLQFLLSRDPPRKSEPLRTMAVTEFLDILLDLRSSLVLGVLVVIFCAHYIRKTKTAPFPPGPRGLPFVGNVLDVPTTHHWLKFAELGNVWGS
jgi:hypothetical protein